ncbi:hypothetical protein [uncultured Amnibacterium sp.]|uniref:hypothetical protein n=1 Tax=uncultured Amnibacterium sp. TaxID=1631851 RepID=UPI0035CBA7B8
MSTTSPHIDWREISHGLWVGRADDLYAGMIERGRRYTFTDAAGSTHPGYRTLIAAQDAVAWPIPLVQPAPLSSVETAATLETADTAADETVENAGTGWSPSRTVVLSIGSVGAGTIALCGFALTLVR